MRRIFLVAQREFLENIKTKGFWIGILIFPVLLTAMIAVPQLLERTRASRKFAVVDQSGWVLDAVQRRIERNDLLAVLSDGAAKRASGDAEYDALPAVAKDMVEAVAELDAPLVHRMLGVLIEGGSSDSLPAAAREVLADEGRAFLQWWRELSPAERASSADGVSAKRFVRVPTPVGDSVTAALNQMVNSDEIFAYFVIGPDPVTGRDSSRYVSNNLTDEDLLNWFGGQVSAEVRDRRLAQESISPQVAQWIQTPVRFDARKVSGAGEEEEVQTRDRARQIAPVIFVYLLWVSVFTVSQMLLTNTIEEKSNRVIEVLLSSVSPAELLTGKIAGIAATGLTIVGSWALMFYFGAMYLPKAFGAPADLNLASLATDPVYIGSFLGYFLLGYLFFAAILSSMGSVCNTLKEAQNLMQPVILLLIVPLMSMVPIMRDPNGTLAKVLSYIPPFTPFVMMNRAAGPPALWEYVATTLLLVVSVGAVLWAGAKVFRIGILLTGKPPKVKEILRWVRAPVGAVHVQKEGR